MSNIPPPPPPVPPPGYVPYAYGRPYASEPRQNGLGIASMVLGIVGVVVPCFWLVQIPGVLAVVFGAVALVQHKNNPSKYRGRGMAVAGLVLGIVAIVILVLLLVFGDWHFDVNSN